MSKDETRKDKKTGLVATIMKSVAVSLSMDAKYGTCMSYVCGRAEAISVYSSDNNTEVDVNEGKLPLTILKHSKGSITVHKSLYFSVGTVFTLVVSRMYNAYIETGSMAVGEVNPTLDWTIVSAFSAASFVLSIK